MDGNQKLLRLSTTQSSLAPKQGDINNNSSAQLSQSSKIQLPLNMYSTNSTNNSSGSSSSIRPSDIEVNLVKNTTNSSLTNNKNLTTNNNNNKENLAVVNTNDLYIDVNTNNIDTDNDDPTSPFKATNTKPNSNFNNNLNVNNDLNLNNNNNNNLANVVSNENDTKSIRKSRGKTIFKTLFCCFSSTHRGPLKKGNQHKNTSILINQQQIDQQQNVLNSNGSNSNSTFYNLNESNQTNSNNNNNSKDLMKIEEKNANTITNTNSAGYLINSNVNNNSNFNPTCNSNVNKNDDDLVQNNLHDKINSNLLPPVRPSERTKKCLIIDLDETLVHSSFKQVYNADFVVPVEIDGTVHQVYVLKRPHVDEFLKRMGELYECVLFTASLAKYADPVADLLDKCGVFKSRLFREACVFYRGNYVKDLGRLGRDLNSVIILDNSPASYMFNPDNAVGCTSWFDDVHDTELRDLIPYFERLARVDSVYSILRQNNQQQQQNFINMNQASSNIQNNVYMQQQQQQQVDANLNQQVPSGLQSLIYQQQNTDSNNNSNRSSSSAANNLNYLINENKILLSIDLMMATKQQQQQLQHQQQ